MNKKNFIKILQNPENLTAEELSFLDEINREFPYFQISKAIYLKTLKENDDIKFKKILISIAAYSRDRKILFDFINKSQNQNEKVYFNKNEITAVLGENKIIDNSNLSSKEDNINKNIELAKNKAEAFKINGKKYNIWVQIASFSNKNSANILKRKFNSVKNINVNKVNINGKTFFRVRIGPFKSVEESKKIYNFLINKGMEGTKIFVE